MMIHPTALVDSKHIGERTRVWAFAHILAGARIGKDCNICDHVFIENQVIVGDRVTIKCGVQLWDGVTLEDDVFVGPNATFSNDRFPRSKQYPREYEKTVVRKGASIGANATILPGVCVGANAMVGAGAVVDRNVPPNAVVVGNPAAVKGYVGTKRPRKRLRFTRDAADEEDLSSTVPGVQIVRLLLVKDPRGYLSVAEYGQSLPFLPKRCFFVYGVPSREVRGEHAHKELHQFLICVSGECSVVVDDGTRRQEILLNKPETGVYIPPMVWATQYNYSADAVLMVLASAPYDPLDYIRDYQEFLNAVRAQHNDASR